MGPIIRGLKGQEHTDRQLRCSGSRSQIVPQLGAFLPHASTQAGDRTQLSSQRLT